MNSHGNNPASTSTQGDAAKSAEVLTFTLHGKAGDRELERVVRGRNRGRLVVLSDRRQLPRPRVQPTIGGAVVVTLGTGEHEREEHLDPRQARQFLDELADAVDLAEHLAREGRHA